MTSSAIQQPGAPLGVGSIIAESFSILMRNFLSVLAIAIVPMLIGQVVSGLLLGWRASLGLADPEFSSGAAAVGSFVSVILQMIIYGITTALLVQLAYDAKLGRPLRIGRYVSPALSAALPIAILAFVAGLLTGLAFLALVIPGLWVYAVFSMMPAAVVIEKVGFGGLGRSAALTKDYRWPILGTLIVIGIIYFAVMFVAGLIVGFIAASGQTSGGLIAVSVLAFSAIGAIGTGLSSITVALIYARLREIKEGASVRDIAAVFD